MLFMIWLHQFLIPKLDKFRTNQVSSFSLSCVNYMNIEQGILTSFHSINPFWSIKTCHECEGTEIIHYVTILSA